MRRCCLFRHCPAKIDDKHKQLVEFSYIDEFQPKIDPETFIAPNATLAGNVEVRLLIGMRMDVGKRPKSVYI